VDLQARLYAGSIAVLLAGLCAASAIYLAAGDDADVDEAYRIVVVDGKAYPIAPGDLKTYVRDLQRFGGKAAVLFDEFNRWFAGLWRGKSLAVTVGWIAVFLSLGLFLFARYLCPHPDAGRENDRGGES
jgi:hypothetical protein